MSNEDTHRYLGQKSSRQSCVGKLVLTEKLATLRDYVVVTNVDSLASIAVDTR